MSESSLFTVRVVSESFLTPIRIPHSPSYGWEMYKFLNYINGGRELSKKLLLKEETLEPELRQKIIAYRASIDSILDQLLVFQFTNRLQVKPDDPNNCPYSLHQRNIYYLAHEIIDSHDELEQALLQKAMPEPKDEALSDFYHSIYALRRSIQHYLFFRNILNKKRKGREDWYEHREGGSARKKLGLIRTYVPDEPDHRIPLSQYLLFQHQKMKQSRIVSRKMSHLGKERHFESLNFMAPELSLEGRLGAIEEYLEKETNPIVDQWLQPEADPYRPLELLNSDVEFFLSKSFQSS